MPAAAGVHRPIPSTGIFIGNVPLHTHGSDFSCDKFAASFNNSTRKTLSYVNPSIQNGEIVVRPSIDVVREGSRRWDNTAVGYFLGRKPYYHHLNEYVRSVWPAVKTVTATSNGFYFFQFKTEIAMEESSKGVLGCFRVNRLSFKRWERGMVLRKHKHTQVPVWIRLRHFPVEFWTDGLRRWLAVGRPLYQDTITRACTRLDFARVCVMLDISSKLPKHLIIMMPKEDGKEADLPGQAATEDTDRTVQHSVGGEVVEEFLTGSYKQPLDLCYVMNAGIWNVRGLNRRDHQVAVKELISESRLQFLGLLETRVSAVNVSRVCKLFYHIGLGLLIMLGPPMAEFVLPLPNARTSDHSPLVIRGDTATHTSYKTGANHAATAGENSMAKGWRSVLTDLLPKVAMRRAAKRCFR
ncbi:UNVERIFIED_CONTAM: hypothetical protein Scaly_3019900 [Sesamum calycinum]|uniref:DUF4283 domain-containing protein n=1 Tax=Sesamum calycinum TaxID=2727403 RepID=A0AAW2KAE4_9LAMI